MPDWTRGRVDEPEPESETELPDGKYGHWELSTTDDGYRTAIAVVSGGYEHAPHGLAVGCGFGNESYVYVWSEAWFLPSSSSVRVRINPDHLEIAAADWHGDTRSSSVWSPDPVALAREMIAAGNERTITFAITARYSSGELWPGNSESATFPLDGAAQAIGQVLMQCRQ